MENNFDYQLKIEKTQSTQYISYLGNGRVGIVHYTGYAYKFVVVDIHKACILWEKEHYETYGGVALPLYDENAVYAPFTGNPEKDSYSTSQTLCAYDHSGKQLWACSLGNGNYQFMVPLAQTETHVATCNTHADKLSMVDKKTGKIACRAKLAHEMYDYNDSLLAWDGKFITIALDNTKDDRSVVDLYDPAVEGGFVKTIFRFPKQSEAKKIEIQTVVGNDMYFFTESGQFCKLNLDSGEITETHTIPKAADAEPEQEFSYNQPVARHGNRLYTFAQTYVRAAERYDMYVCIYDLNTGVFDTRPLPLVIEDNLLQLHEGDCYRLSAEGIVRIPVLENEQTKEISLDEWKKDIDSIFLTNSQSGEHWLVAEGKLLVMPRSKTKRTFTTGVMHCWKLSEL